MELKLALCVFVLLGLSRLASGDKYHRASRVKRETGSSEGVHNIPYADWNKIATDSLEKILSRRENTKRAKNVIFFLGDGMGVSTLTTARLHQAQEERITLDRSHLAWDNWHDSALIKTYNSDASTPDSAGTATAFNCGVKARMGVIGVTDAVQYEQCDTMTEATQCTSAFHHALQRGKWGGLVTTTRITHATPAAAYAHSPSRNWEYYSEIPVGDRDKCVDIAKQLVHTDINKDIKVILGGGRGYFMMDNETDPEYPEQKGRRPDTNLINDWLQIKEESGIDKSRYSFIHNQQQFDNIDPKTTDYLFGLFEPSHMKYELDRAEDTQGEPSLVEMVDKSINLLSRSPDGYFLYVEGGRIDHAHHDGNAQRALADTVQLSRAVERAASLVNLEETLLVVTADHSHVFTLGGYTHIDTHMYGVVHNTYKEMQIADDNVPYLMLTYANGPGSTQHRNPDNTRKDLRATQASGEFNNKDYMQDSLVPLEYETHGGEDVMAFAIGPWAHTFSGTQEQHYVAHALMHAACLGSFANRDHCEGTVNKCSNNAPPALLIFIISIYLNSKYIK